MGGGVVNHGTMTIRGATIANNSAGQIGGGVVNRWLMTISGGTIANNSAEVRRALDPPPPTRGRIARV